MRRSWPLSGVALVSVTITRVVNPNGSGSGRLLKFGGAMRGPAPAKSVPDGKRPLRCWTPKAESF